MKLVDIYIDGASKGNPGHAGIGVVILKDGKVLRTLSNYIGQATNNFAEYSALIYALEEALIIKAEAIKINSDSQLLCRQLNKVYKIKSDNIINLYNQAVHLLSGFKVFSINHIPREKNTQADKLANKAVKEALKNKNVI